MVVSFKKIKATHAQNMDRQSHAFSSFPYKIENHTEGIMYSTSQVHVAQLIRDSTRSKVVRVVFSSVL